MQRYEIHIPADDTSPARVERVHGDNWLDGLRRGLKAAGLPAPTRNLRFDLRDDGSVEITDAGSGAVYSVCPLDDPMVAPATGARAIDRDGRPPVALEGGGLDDPFEDGDEVDDTTPPSGLQPMALRSRARGAERPRDTAPAAPRAPEAARPSGLDTVDFDADLSFESHAVRSKGPPPLPAEVTHPGSSLLDELERLALLGDDVYQACGFVLDAAIRHIPSAAGSVLLVDARDRCLYFAAARGPAAQRLKTQRVPLEVGLAGASIRTRRSLNIDDPARDPRFARNVADTVGHLPRCILVAPIVQRRRAFGVIELLDRAGAKGFSDDEERTLRRAARRLGGYIAGLLDGE